ncbi:TlpA disulfide reductase family protein [Cellulophaga baltica]|uniref:TlpA disulfide reductase family protein n=1 Tax=Cellulophaga baltica TaxID=76594 RepID=UPI0015F6A252|nr:TlpA disulfide reductase family protein [Cellulophaga baltica]MBA6316307.1 AhpC/TSA family protein [Cellulophaga baltica]
MKHIIKKAVFVLFIVVFVFSNKTNAQETNNKFTLTGEIKGLSGNLYYNNPDREYTREFRADSIIVVDGKFQLSDSISKLALLRVYPSFRDKNNKVFKIPKGGVGYFPVKCAYLMFYAFPGGNITVSGEATDFVNAYPSGDKYNNSLAAANKITYPNYNKMGNLAVQNTYETDSLKIKENELEAEKIFKTNTEALIAHIKANPKSLAAAWYLNDMLVRSHIENEQAEALFNNLSTELSKYADYKDVAARIEGTKATKEGFPVPAIKTTATLDGKEFDIKSLRGKYVLIDFWGIWCGPCVAEMPEVKIFQEKHKDKLVVLGINSGDTKEKVQNFINEKGYDWQQILSSKKSNSDNFVNRFNVQGFPTKLIINRRGNIVKRFVGGGEEAFQLLEELLNK